MTTMMIWRNEKEAKRFWENQERLLNIPLSEKQIVFVMEKLRMDT